MRSATRACTSGASDSYACRPPAKRVDVSPSTTSTACNEIACNGSGLYA